MRKYEFSQFGVENLTLTDVDPPQPGSGEVLLDVKALSLNFRDLLVLIGAYNPKLELPATPISDGAGVVTAIGEGVTRVKVGDKVMSHFVSGWLDGPYRGEYLGTTLGTPRASLAAEQAVLPADAVVPIPRGYDFADAATLPIAALTAWTALTTEGNLQPGQTVLTLGTGGVSIFALQLAKAMGAKVIITSRSDEKLARARKLGADHTINYEQNPDWAGEVWELTDRAGVDVVVENGGVATLSQSLKATRPGGTIAMLGSLTGLEGAVDISPIIMKRIRVAGIVVGPRESFSDLVRFIEKHETKPVIDRHFPFDKLPDALGYLGEGKHFAKIVIDV
jgi:NADPH:quinone reductase-like Zn-dependent oxidoreductase